MIFAKKKQLKEGDSLIHVTLKKNLLGILGLKEKQELDNVLEELERNTIERTVHISATKSILKNLTVGFHKDGYTYYFLNEVTDAGLKVNLYGRHKKEDNVKIVIHLNKSNIKGVVTKYREVDNIVALRGCYIGLAEIGLLKGK